MHPVFEFNSSSSGFSFSERVEPVAVNRHPDLTDCVTIQNFPRSNRAENHNVRHGKLKNVASIELEQDYIMEFVHLKGRKLDDIAMELSSLEAPNGKVKPSRTQWLQLKLGRKEIDIHHVDGQPPFDDVDTEIL